MPSASEETGDVMEAFFKKLPNDLDMALMWNFNTCFGINVWNRHNVVSDNGQRRYKRPRKLGNYYPNNQFNHFLILFIDSSPMFVMQ